MNARLLGKRTRIWGVAIALILGASGLALGIGISQAKAEAALPYDSRQEALSAFQEELAGRTLTDAEEQIRVLGSFADEWDVYYVLTEPQPYGGDGPEIFCVAVVHKDGDRFGYGKATPDVSLRPQGAHYEEGSTGYYYGEFLDVQGHRIGIGAVLEVGLVPYVDGQELFVGAGGAFASITDGEPIYIVVERP